MASTSLVPKYHRAPNFSINPPDAGGLLELGSLIIDIANADEPPINEECRLPIPHNQLFCSHQEGFEATRSRLRSGEYGVVAKLMGLGGVGGEVSGKHGKSDMDVLSVRKLDTIYFAPSPEYLRESMAMGDVKEYIEGTGYEPVYLVTGLKIARGPRAKAAKSKERGAVLEVGVHPLVGVPFEVGPKVSMARETRDEVAFQSSTDFIAGIRVRKLVYKKHWLLRRPGGLTSNEFNKGATMVDDEYVGRAGDGEEVLDLGESDIPTSEHELDIVDEQTVEIGWVL
ncbi:hypothetical protein F4808DRAFT_266323 [Astrocystis sublimbata]|nr:hypothetical protein F4808DRAFT_266323 [Astrocystis sublimbata]